MYADGTILLNYRLPSTLEVCSAVALNMAIQYCHSSSFVVNKEKSEQRVFDRRKDQVERGQVLERYDRPDTDMDTSY